jgi:hypothetical protein
MNAILKKSSKTALGEAISYIFADPSILLQSTYAYDNSSEHDDKGDLGPPLGNRSDPPVYQQTIKGKTMNSQQ